MWVVYTPRSQKDGHFYTGMTDNLSRRIAQHQSGHRGTRSTRNRGPFVLVYSEEYETRKDARDREKFLKSGYGREWRDKHFKT